MNVLRLITAGSVDDGKSTLIGRLLYDAKLIAEDHLTSITQTSAKRGYEGINLALLTDGLRAEREQGITIDVAYRYFQTPKRKFILADTPGHVQYTRNMVTAASNADVAVILIDARHGVTEQTRRHTILAKLLGIRTIIVCVNKMDLVAYSESVFRSIMREHEGLFAVPNEVRRNYIPISALNGDNLIRQSSALSWYEGRTLLETLEGVENTVSSNAGGALVMQGVVRMQKGHDEFRGYTGRIINGSLGVHDSIVVLPSIRASTIKSIRLGNDKLDRAHSPQSVLIELEHDLDISRGDILVRSDTSILLHDTLPVTLCWFADRPAIMGEPLLFQQHSRVTPCRISKLTDRLNIRENRYEELDTAVELNDIIRGELSLAEALPATPYNESRDLGSGILIDRLTGETLGAVLIDSPGT